MATPEAFYPLQQSLKTTERGIGVRVGGSSSGGRRGVGLEGYIFNDDGEE